MVLGEKGKLFSVSFAVGHRTGKRMDTAVFRLSLSGLVCICC